ncbi:hypothetical protein GX411_09465, partial [Candidatus Fermentibacteria bacterium]|nr:hypothetical protein [Candidatus Fermentibacteria bacterium]
YASEEWYPDTLVRLVGEFRLRDLRVGIVDVYPVQYLASEDSLRAWSDVEVALSYDTTADWPTCGLGCYEGLIGNRLLGYTPEPPPWAPVPGIVMRPSDLVAGPARVPDYVILVAAGLDGWWADTLAQHRAGLNGFDVAIVSTDSVVSQFGEDEDLSPDLIREFTEAMWDWGSAETKRPSYLLLIGDHEAPDSAQAGWFLPTKTFYTQALGFLYANDSWYSYFGESRSDSSLIPDMMVGRLPARRTDNLQDMIQTIRDFEAASSFPAPDSLSWRRYLTRLQGSPPIDSGNWLPTAAWTDSIRAWCGYGWDNVYCGDCAAGDAGDHSTMTSDDWDTCLSTYLTRGQQIALYTDHGIPHCFSAGADWHSAPPLPWHFGLPDSTFGVWDVDSLPAGNGHHGHPFLICCCCGTGSFDHTVGQHYDNFDATYCHNSDTHKPPVFDYPIDCLAERFLKNTDGGAIAVFASSGASSTGGQYQAIGGGMIRAVLFDGQTRVGEAIAAMRLNGLGNLVGNCGLGRYNLLGDPAVDIGDRVKFRDRCDLVISPEDIQTCRYPTRTVAGTNRPTRLLLTVRNAGAIESGEFDTALRVTSESNYDTILTTTCDGLEPGEEQLLSYGWRVPRNFHPPVEVTLHAVADPDGDCDDSWTPNNDASMTFELMDIYPNDEGFPIRVPGSVKSPPLLADLDGDEDLEIVVIVGSWSMSAYDPDDPDEPMWTAGPFHFNPSSDGACNVPLVADILGSEGPEIIADTPTGLLVMEGSSGEVICIFAHEEQTCLPGMRPLTPVVANVITGNNSDEIAFLLSNSLSGSTSRLSLMILAVSGDSLVLADSLPMHVTANNSVGGWLCSEDLDEDSYDEIVVSQTWFYTSHYSGLWICDYDPGNEACFFSDSIRWTDGSFSRFPVPAVGELSGIMRIAMSRQRNSSLLSPAYILDAGLTLVD